MANVMNPHQGHLRVERTVPQKVCIGMGVALIIIGVMGVMMPGLMGMHLSMAHNMIHLVTGGLALMMGHAGASKAYNFSLGFGAFYGFLGILGFMIGEPGYPSVGNMEADQNLFRMIPNILELGRMDHAIHLLISTIFLFTAFSYRKDKNFKVRDR